MTFRFDDVSCNSNMVLHHQMTDYLFERFPGCEIIWAISPIVHATQKESGRVFPKVWNAMSDNRVHYRLNHTCNVIPHPKVKVATHGLIHCDHRLMDIGAQELSIILSASLTGANMFVPPFNKYSRITEEICAEQGIELVKWEDGWASMEHNEHNRDHQYWYLHAREWTMDRLKKWFDE